MHALHGNGPSNTRVPNNTNTIPSYQAMVRYRFHNIRGLADPSFRKLYLNRARSSTDVLLLAETKCGCGNAPDTPISLTHKYGRKTGTRAGLARSGHLRKAQRIPPTAGVWHSTSPPISL